MEMRRKLISLLQGCFILIALALLPGLRRAKAAFDKTCNAPFSVYSEEGRSGMKMSVKS